MNTETTFNSIQDENSVARRRGWRSYVVFFLRILLGLTFLISAISKFTDLPSFEKAIKGFDVVPVWMINPLVILLPALEAISGTSLIVGLGIRYSAVVIIVMLLVFVAVIIPNVAIGDSISCGCFGPLSQSKADGMLILRDLLMVGIAVIVFASETHRFSIGNIIHRRKG